MAKKYASKKPVKDTGRTDKKEGNAYDKIYRQIAEVNFLPMAEEKMGVKFISWIPLQEKIPTSNEREVDFLYKITTEDGIETLLHIEFQTEDDPKMIFRMIEYHGFLIKKHRKPVRHFVVYFGAKKPVMRTQLLPEEIFSGFDLINIGEMDPNSFLDAGSPQSILLAVLADYPKEQTEDVLRLSFRRLKELSVNNNEFSEYAGMLTTLARLRKSEDLTIKIKEEMPYRVEVEKDPYFIQGIEKGKKEGIEKGEYKKNYEFVVNLLMEQTFSDTKIAALANVDISFVERVKVDLLNKHK